MIHKGYRVKLGKSLITSNYLFDYLSGPDEARFSDLQDAFNDKSIDAVFCLKGGYGTSRLLPFINSKQFSTNKKIILGYSDITALLLYLYQFSNFVTFHGPLLGAIFLNENLSPNSTFSDDLLWKMLTDRKFQFSYQYDKSFLLCGGVAEGELIGGNLSVICSLLGTQYSPSFKRKILFLEDCSESLYKIDRMITQLENANVFSQVRGVLFTSFYKCGFKSKFDRSLLNLLSTKVKKYNIPAIYGFPVGHGKQNYILPIGKKVLFNSYISMLSSS